LPIVSRNADRSFDVDCISCMMRLAAVSRDGAGAAADSAAHALHAHNHSRLADAIKDFSKVLRIFMCSSFLFLTINPVVWAGRGY